MVLAQPLARPLVDEVSRAIARRGAYALLRLRFESGGDTEWLKAAPDELIATLPSIVVNEYAGIDSYVAIVAPENTREGADVPRDRLTLYQQSLREHTRPFLAGDKPWVGTFYPTAAFAQDAGMTLRAFEEFVLGAILIDWPALERQMRHYADQ